MNCSAVRMIRSERSSASAEVALALGEIAGGLAAVREVVRASAQLVQHHPGGSDQSWQRAEDRLWP
jgi:hypothetical protein